MAFPLQSSTAGLLIIRPPLHSDLRQDFSAARTPNVVPGEVQGLLLSAKRQTLLEYASGATLENTALQRS